MRTFPLPLVVMLLQLATQLLMSTNSPNPTTIPTSHQTSYATHNTSSLIPPPDLHSTPTTSDPALPWGDDIHQDPGDLFRVYYQNVNGIQADTEDISAYFYLMQNIQVGYFGFAEPNINFNEHSGITTTYNKLTKRFWRNCRTATISSNVPAPSKYKPGGIAVTVTDKWTSRTDGLALSDPSGLGRWTGFSFIGKNNTKCSIITGYRVHANARNTGNRIQAQQYALLAANKVKQPNPRRQFITDLIEYVSQLQTVGHEILINLDANEIIGNEADGLTQLCDTCHLLDIHGHMYPDPPATYNNGTPRRLDYMLGTPGILHHTKRCGVLPVNDGILSDHRGLFLDIDLDAILGGRTDDPTHGTSRSLNSEHPELSSVYREHLKAYLEDHNVFARLTNLSKSAPNMSVNAIKQEYEKIDRDITRGMMCAEKRISKPVYKYQWSPDLRNAGLTARYWRIRYREKKYLYPLQRQRDRLALQLPSIDDTVDVSLSSLLTLWKTAKSHLKQVQKSAAKHRSQHLEDLLAQYEDDLDEGCNRAKAKHTKKTIAAEAMRSPWKTINAAMSNPHTGSISRLWLPEASVLPTPSPPSYQELIRMAQNNKASVTYSTVVESNAIEAALLEYNRNWFQQAKSTPFGHGRLYDDMGFDGLTPKSKEVLTGTYKVPNNVPVDRALHEFLKHCKQPSNVKPIDTNITSEDFIYGMKGWKETTSTSPSGRHLGHYKSALPDSELVDLHVGMLNLPIKYGFAPSRWLTSITPLIEKENGKPYLQRLRVIHLFEADFNFFLKIIFGSRMVKNAEKCNALNDQNFGSRKNKTPMDAVFLKRVTYDLINQLKINAASMDNDATGCYDRIIVSLGMIACQRLGVPISSIKCHADALRYMKYSIKTVYGVSEESYTGTIFEPLFGTGQGSGASPAVWLALVCILLNAFDSLAKDGYSFQDPWNEVTVARNVDAFVDDTSLGLTAHDSITFHELTTALQHSSQLWERLLHTSGGALNLSKCFWYIQHWTWKNGRPVCSKVDQTQPELLMTKGEDTHLHTIERVENDSPRRTLGVYLSPCHELSSHTKHLKTKTDFMAAKLRTSSLSKAFAYMVYQSKYLPTILYSLPVCTMSTTQLQSIQVPFIASLLNKLGLNCNYPRAVVYGPADLCGLQLTDLRYEQGIQQIQSFLNYIGTSHSIGQYITISFRHLQLELGLTDDILQYPPCQMSYATTSWTKHMLQFMYQHDISIMSKDHRHPNLSRIHDVSIMDAVVQSKKFTSTECKDINLVRVYLKIVTLSDITNGRGDSIALEAYKAVPFSDRTSMFPRWPRQPLISQGQRLLWRRMLRVLFLRTDSQHLNQPLGAWTNLSNMQWNVYAVSPSTISLRISTQRFALYQITKTRRLYQSDITALRTTSKCPQHGIPCTTHGTTVSLYFPVEDSQPPPRLHLSSDTMPPFLRSLPSMHHRLLVHSKALITNAIVKLKRILERKVMLHAGSDGGLAYYKGTFSWLLLGCKENPIWKGVGPSDGYWRCQSSNRSELTGATSFALFIFHFVQYYNIDLRATINYYIDNKSALKKLQSIKHDTPYQERCLQSNHDLISTLRITSSIFKHIQFHHVKSHQDTHAEDINQLHISAKINILCDRLAEQYYQRYQSGPWAPSETPMIPSSSAVHITIHGHHITSHYTDQLRYHISHRNHKKYLLQSKKWSIAIWKFIDFDALRRLHGKRKAYRISTLSKLQHGWLNLGTQRSQLLDNNNDAKRCPCCSIHVEDFTHLLTCSSGSMRSHRFKHLTQALRRLDQYGTNKPTIDSLTRAIKAWVNDPSKTPQYTSTGIPTHLRPTLAQAFSQQQQIGWDNFFCGFVSSLWSRAAHLKPDGKLNLDLQTSWSKHLVQTAQSYSILTWEARNTILHNKSPDCQALVESSINHQINTIYTTLSSYPLSPTDLQLFEPQHLLLQQSLRYRRQWIAQARLILDSSNNRFLLDQHLLTTFYNFGTPSTSTPRPTSAPSPPVRRFVQLPLPGMAQVPQSVPHRMGRLKRKLRRLRDTVNRTQLTITSLFPPI